jgi:hypothetical protein
VQLRRVPRALSALYLGACLLIGSGWVGACSDQLDQRVTAESSPPARMIVDGGGSGDAQRPAPAEPTPSSRSQDAVEPPNSAPVSRDAGGASSGVIGGAAAAAGDLTDMDAGLVTDLPLLHATLTEYLGQLTGHAPNALADLGMTGTDLGVSFEYEHDLLFLFGDSWTLDPNDVDGDSIARTAGGSRPNGTPVFQWYKRASGAFLALEVSGVALGAMNVPVEGLVLDGDVYLFFTAGYDPASGRHSTSVLAHARADAFDQLVLDHAVASDKFLNVSLVRDGDVLWIWGSGAYRQSPVYLARATTRTLTDRSSWSYYRGRTASGSTFGPDESSAVPVVDANCVGELSVRKDDGLGCYWMTYNCSSPPRGIVLRAARAPEGPWSEPILIYEPDQGYEHFIHAQQSAVGHDDGLSEKGREEEWGGEYAPYLVPAWFSQPAAGLHEIVYTLSSWNPYQVHLLRTLIAEPGVDAPQPMRGAGLPPARLVNADFAGGSLEGWNAEGDSFATFQDANGAWAVTTFTAKQDAVLGRLWQEFSVDDRTSSLSFEVHGGHASVALYVGDTVVRRSRARDNNDARVKVVWQLSTLRGQTVRLAIEDDVQDAWGFISVSGFQLR